jgi:hypothetical protein
LWSPRSRPLLAFSEKGPDRWNNPQRWKYLVHYDRHVLRCVQTGARFRFAGIALGALVRRAFYHFALAVQHKQHRAGESATRWRAVCGLRNCRHVAAQMTMDCTRFVPAAGARQQQKPGSATVRNGGLCLDSSQQIDQLPRFDAKRSISGQNNIIILCRWFILHIDFFFDAAKKSRCWDYLQALCC